MPDLLVKETAGGVVFGAKVVPGSSRTVISGVLDGMLKVKVSAAPEKGKANQALSEFLAKKLGVRKRAVRVISGQSSPIKQVEVDGITGEEFVRKLKLDTQDKGQ